MLTYAYTAIGQTGKRTAGSLKASDRHEALRQVISRGYHPIMIQPLAKPTRRFISFSKNGFFCLKISELAVMTRQLASLLKAGLPVAGALATLQNQCGNATLSGIVRDIEDQLVQEGCSLAEALETYPQVFDPVYRGLVRAGESTGHLAEVLANLSGHLSQAARLRRQVWGAFIYPLFLLILGTAAVFVLMAFVIPRFQEMFTSLGQQLPLPTQWLMAVSGFLASWWWMVILTGLVLAGLFFLSLRRESIRIKIDLLTLRFPVIGKVLSKIEIARIAYTLSMLLRNGVRIIEAMRITAETVRNHAIKATFGKMIQGISEGKTLASVFGSAGRYPAIVTDLIHTGETTGELPRMLDELSDIYQDEAERAVTAAVKLLEPTLICVMGAVITAIVAAVILPILKTNFLVGG